MLPVGARSATEQKGGIGSQKGMNAACGVARAPDIATIARRGPRTIPPPTGVRVWVATGHSDMRKGIPSLALQVSAVMQELP